MVDNCPVPWLVEKLFKKVIVVYDDIAAYSYNTAA